MSRVRRGRRSWWWRYPLALAMIGFALLPVLWVVSASLNPAKTLVGASLLPENPGFVNYDDLINHPSYPYETWLWNSIKITVISVSLTVMITTLAGYALSRFRFAGKKAFMTGILILNVFPAVLSIIALFGMMQQIGTQISWLGLDTHGGLIAIYVSFGMGINVLLVKAYIDRLPRELDESALVDGATYGQVFRKIVFPLIRPIIVTVSVLQFFAVYGDFVIARVMLRSTDNLTVMVGLLLFQTQRFEQDWGVITAGAVLASLPVLLLYIPVQKYVISGLTSGSVKE
ncbi:MAG TPA: sugar ABC transporter permease [Ilumatobacteraceae bacterium]|nr:sugar ABC transporter permease [Ilumatobacteraceae bacterium]